MIYTGLLGDWPLSPVLLKEKKKIRRMIMVFDFSKLSGTKKTQEVSLGDQKVTVTEIPFILLLRVKKIQRVLASCISRFTQSTPLSKQSRVKESMPLGQESKQGESDMVTETLSLDLPNVTLIDKSVELRETAINSLLEALLNEELLYDVLRTTVIEFKDVEQRVLLGDDGLTFPMMLQLVKAIIELNSKDLEFLGNFFSLLKQKG